MKINKKPFGYWTKERVIAEAKKYQSQAEWRRNGGGSMHAARQNGWMDEAAKHMTPCRKTNGYWTKENVLADAGKYAYQAKWNRDSSGAFHAAKRNGWLNEACSHMTSPHRPMGYWTQARLIADAKKYTSRTEWKKGNGSAYAIAGNNGWLDICCDHMLCLVKPAGFWTKEKCTASAKKYNTIVAWSLAEGAAYDAAKRKHWYKEATKHMIKTFSHGEHTIYSFLLQHDIKFDYQKKFKNLKDKKQLPYDFYLTDFNLVIEYQGRQHFKTSQNSIFRKNAIDQPRRDAIKKEYAEKNGMFYLDIVTQKTDEIENSILRKLKEISNINGRTLSLVKRVLDDEELKVLSNLGVWTKKAVLADAL